MIENIKSANGKMSIQGHICRGVRINLAPRQSERNLYDIIEEDPIRCYNYIETESVKTLILIPRMALCLSAKAIEQICDHILTRKDIDEEFLELFYQYFFRVYVKRVYSWSSLHLLIKASKAYPVHFKTTVEAMLIDTEVPNNILLDYVRTLNQKDCTKLMNTVTEIQLMPEQFSHNVAVLCAIFRKSQINESIFGYVIYNLELYNIYCTFNAHYGRLLLLLIERLAYGFIVRLRFVERMIENHRTAFKSVCLAALEEYEAELLFRDLA